MAHVRVLFTSDRSVALRNISAKGVHPLGPIRIVGSYNTLTGNTRDRPKNFQKYFA
jgi:hypothetical protein